MLIDIPMKKIWWLYIPVLFMIVQIGLECSFDPQTLAAMHSEQGPHELVQFFVMCGAFLVALATLVQMDRRANPWLALWLLLATISCFYVAAEEVSWGQQILNWDTPEFWAHVNDQNETNLHNTSSWLDQKPRLILEIGVLVGGLIIPLLNRFKPHLLPQRFAMIYPTAQFSVITIIPIGIKIVDASLDALGIRSMERPSEVVELYVFYFVLLYLVMLRRRCLPARA